MKAQLEKRLQELKTEFEAGQKMLADLEAKRANLQNTLLRITGAIQVLQEELARADSENNRAPEVEKMAAEA
jgi:chromosome segregation ATPase